jgi:hypothetical protein
VIAEEFDLGPRAAAQEPLPLALRIIELRSYARVRQQVEQAEKPDDVPRSPMLGIYKQVQLEKLKARSLG